MASLGFLWQYIKSHFSHAALAFDWGFQVCVHEYSFFSITSLVQINIFFIFRKFPVIFKNVCLPLYPLYLLNGLCLCVSCITHLAKILFSLSLPLHLPSPSSLSLFLSLPLPLSISLHYSFFLVFRLPNLCLSNFSLLVLSLLVHFGFLLKINFIIYKNLTIKGIIFLCSTPEFHLLHSPSLAFSVWISSFFSKDFF